MIIGNMVTDVYFLEHAGEAVVPGGAANAIHKVAIYAVGVIGDDNVGQQLTQVPASVSPRQLQQLLLN